MSRLLSLLEKKYAAEYPDVFDCINEYAEAFALRNCPPTFYNPITRFLSDDEAEHDDSEASDAFLAEVLSAGLILTDVTDLHVAVVKKISEFLMYDPYYFGVPPDIPNMITFGAAAVLAGVETARTLIARKNLGKQRLEVDQIVAKEVERTASEYQAARAANMEHALTLTDESYWASLGPEVLDDTIDTHTGLSVPVHTVVSELTDFTDPNGTPAARTFIEQKKWLRKPKMKEAAVNVNLPVSIEFNPALIIADMTRRDPLIADEVLASSTTSVFDISNLQPEFDRLDSSENAGKKLTGDVSVGTLTQITGDKARLASDILASTLEIGANWIASIHADLERFANAALIEVGVEGDPAENQLLALREEALQSIVADIETETDFRSVTLSGLRQRVVETLAATRVQRS